MRINLNVILLAFELPDGRLKLIDGHLRRDLDPDMEVDVEILDVTEEEARTLLLSIDPLATLAETQSQIHQRLLDLTPPISDDLTAAWHGSIPDPQSSLLDPQTSIPAQFFVLIKCRDEPHQVELLKKLAADNLDCRALIS